MKSRVIRCLIVFGVLLLICCQYFIMQSMIITDRFRSDTNSTYVRAAIVYFPTEQLDKFGPQLQWFMHSWKEMQRHEPIHWNTDIIVVSTTYIPFFSELNCTLKVRKSSHEPSQCRIVPNYKALNIREEAFKAYKYGDSIDSIVYADEQGALRLYDALLRTDLDTFLTPAFSTWKPSKLAVGIGKYCFKGQITCHRLNRIANDMGLAPIGRETIENIGSTWYGKGTTVIHCAKTSMRVMRYLNQYEFTQADKESQISRGALNWPGWHYGVLTMYSGQIAINFCTQGFDKRPEMLDVGTDSIKSVYDHAHLHTWQNKRNFSKFVFSSGGYKNVNTSRLNVTIVREYALFHALEGTKR